MTNCSTSPKFLRRICPVLVIVALQCVTVRALGCQEKSALLGRRKKSVEVDGGELLGMVRGQCKTSAAGNPSSYLSGGRGVAESKHILNLSNKRTWKSSCKPSSVCAVDGRSRLEINP